MSAFVDFSEVKARYSIEDVMKKLGLNLQLKGSQYRCSCPRCGGNDRTLVITPSKGFYCFASQKGGDQIELVAHLEEVSAKEAAQWIVGKNSSPHSSQGRSEGAQGSPPKELQALSYLESHHPAVTALGFEDEVASAIGVGFASRGTMSGRVLIPLRLPDGRLTGYVGVNFADDVPLKLPTRFVL